MQAREIAGWCMVTGQTVEGYMILDRVQRQVFFDMADEQNRKAAKPQRR